MHAPIPVTHDPSFWAAIAGGASAIAAIASLLGLAQTVRQAKRSADATEEATRRQLRPVMAVSRSDQIPSSDNSIALIATNAGTGVALGCVWFLASEEVFSRSTSNQEFNRELPKELSEIHFMGGGKPLGLGQETYFEVPKPTEENATRVQINYADALGNAHQSNFAVTTHSKEFLVLNLGSNEFSAKQIRQYQKDRRAQR